MSLREESRLLKPLTRESLPKSEPSAINSSGSEGNRHETNISQTPTLNPNPLFRNGMPLPKEIKSQLTDTLKHVPLEEIDPFYIRQNTFLVIGNERIYRFSRNRTLLSLSPFNAFRRFSLYLLTHWFFSAFIVAVVLLNCFFALKNTSTNNALFLISEYVFLSIYTAELLLTIIGRGLIIVPFACLRIPWGIFNLFIVVTGFLYINYSMWILKIAYALRILKIIPYVSGLQIGFEFILGIIQRIRSIFISCALVTIVFSTMGIHLFMGSLTQRCIPNAKEADLNYNSSIPITNTLDTIKIEEQHENAFLQDHSALFCGNNTCTRQCNQGFTCLMGIHPNPNYGYSSFDSFPTSVLQILRLIMQDSPEDLYNMIWATSGPWHIIYFAAIFIFGTLALKSYVLAIIAKAIINEEMNSPVETDEHSFRPGKKCDFLCGWNCSETFIIVRETVAKFINHSLTDLFICAVIVTDTLTMASYFYGIEDNPVIYLILYYISKICFAVYIVEFVLKCVTQSPLSYFQNYWNIFDFFIIVLYIVNKIYKKLEIAENTLDILLVMRMFKIGSRWPTFELYIVILHKVLKRYLPYFLLTLLSVYSFGILGMHLFQGSYLNVGLENGKPIWTFSNFVSSCMISFRIVCGEWVESLWDCLHLAGKPCFAYFLSAVIILNTLLALLSVSTIFTTYKVLKMRENDKSTYEKSTYESIRDKVMATVTIVRLKWIKRFSNKTAAETDGVIHNDLHIHQMENNLHESTRSSGSSGNKYKQIVTKIQDHRFSKMMSILVILISSIALIPNDIQHGFHPKFLQIILYTIEIFFTVYFLIHIIISAISHGFLKSFCKPSWLFDTLVISEMVLNLAMLDFYSPGFQWNGILSLRTLRPLMLISRLPRLKATFKHLTKQFAFLIKFLLVSVFVWLFFAIQGVHIYSGQFYRCVGMEEAASYAKAECLASNMSWINAKHKFDETSSSFINIALIVTRSGWQNIWMNILTAHKEYEKMPSIDFMDSNAYILAVIIFGAFFICNVLFGAVIYHNKKNKEIFMTCDQIEDYNKKKEGRASATIIDTPSTFPLKWIHDLVFSTVFNGLVMAVILIDTVALAGASLNASDRILALLHLIFAVVTVLYTFELILKLIGWRHTYFKNPLNVLDLVVVTISISGYLIDKTLLAIAVAVLRPLRILRILHFKPFLNRAQTISKFLLGLTRIYPVLINLIFLLLLFLYTYAALGMSLFKNIPLDENSSSIISFRTFSLAILTLFQLTTFSGWDAILERIGNEYDCNISQCGDFSKATLFLLSYLFIVFIIVTNMYAIFVLEILNCFDVGKHSSDDALNPRDGSEPLSTIVETINLNPSCSLSARRKSVACFVIEDDNNRDAQIVILPQETVQVVFRP